MTKYWVIIDKETEDMYFFSHLEPAQDYLDKIRKNHPEVILQFEKRTILFKNG